MKVKIDQLDDEVNKRNADLIIQQLKKENDRLHQLVNKHHESRVKRISVVVSIHVCYRNDRVATYVYTYIVYIYYMSSFCLVYIYYDTNILVAQNLVLIPLL